MENDLKYELSDKNPNEQNYDINRIQDQEVTALAYNKTFDLVVKVISETSESDSKKIYAIILKLIKNIITNPNEEKFRKLKLSNSNIQSLFTVNGAYDFFCFLGFNEEIIDCDLCLFSRNMDIELLKVIYSYLNLLVVNEEDNNDNEYNAEENSTANINQPYPSFNEVISQGQRSNFVKKKKKTMIDILKETKDIRLFGYGNFNEQNYYQSINLNENSESNNMNSFSHYNPPNNSNNNSSNILNAQSNTKQNLSSWKNYASLRNNKPQDIKSVLKETAGIRRNNSEYFSNSYNVVPNNNFPSGGSGNYNNNNGSNNLNSRFVNLNDLKFSNPEIENVFKHNFKVNDSIGKKCLELSNEFRKRNGLSPLQWEDNVWKISFEHSRNMGIYKVKFGHDGFNERIRKLPFYFSLACENVFMCQGVSEYNLAEMAINGWINSPGHRKNLLSTTSHCSIAVYRNNGGEFFLTQIFVRK